jgi:alpha-ketoglutarate-dependent 2,4-dichlorophenoxyacetate dioxygenase
MTIEAMPLSPPFGAEIRGADLRRPVPPALLAEIAAALDRYAVLVFKDQHLDDAAMLAFSRLLGPVEALPYYSGEAGKARSEIGDISNLDSEGGVQSPDDPRQQFLAANLLWHTDGSYKTVPVKYTLLSAREVPPAGGETEFADLRAAYDALPETRRLALEGLIAEHDLFHSRAQAGFAGFTDQVRRTLPPVRQVLVRRLLRSGRKTLYLASHAKGIVGWSDDAGRKLLAELMAFATEPRFVYRHRWTVGDLVLWDDRCTMHRLRPFDSLRHRRRLRRTTVADVASTLAQAVGSA